jgi:hypothetical protein
MVPLLAASAEVPARLLLQVVAKHPEAVLDVVQVKGL